ncbi:MAG: bifunctional oligoribonuclease/PAP phosphatase NrnA [Termitinemataceae bacterium]|nr:MAG: bifunctional oligoribonuclease/PAP phosphatase NrnA [Termitinemataceae bacterium]
MFIASEPPSALLDFINKYNNFLIAGHTEPDGDCVSCQLVLSSALRRLGKTAIPCQAGPFKRREIAGFESQFTAEISNDIRQNAALIIVDCSSIERTGALKDCFKGMPVAVIDHHATGKAIDSEVSYIDASAPAAMLLVYSLIKALNVKINEAEAQLLFLGLAADTGFFRHLDEGSAGIFDVAADLVRAGANPKTVFNIMNGGKSLNSRRLLGAILCRTESHFEGKLIISSEERGDSERYGLESRDSDTLYQLLLAIEGVEAIAVIRQETDEKCTIGLRSRDSVDVSLIAAALGGGGHKNASGLSAKGQIKEIRAKVLAEFKKVFL